MFRKRLFHSTLLILIILTTVAAKSLPTDQTGLQPSAPPASPQAPNGPNIKFNVSVGRDANACATQDSLTVATGTQVFYCYEVENTGDVTLARHTLVDDQLGTLLNNFAYDLLPGASVFITASLMITGTLANVASWTAFTEGGTPVNELDSALVTVVDAGISLNKTVGTDTLSCAATDSIIVPVGTKVTYCYTVTNTGTENLVTHTLVDDKLGTLLNNLPYVLVPSASAFITATAVINTATVNNATWTGSTGGVSYSASDSAKVSISDGGASLSLNKTVGTNTTTCAASDSITVLAGTKVTYCYTVSNTGNQNLVTHTLVDDQLGTILNNLPYVLVPGASAFITQSVTVNSSVTNTAAWTALTGGGLTASGLDTATVTVGTELPSLLLNKTVGEDPLVCAAADSITVPAGSVVTYCYTVTNTGPLPLVSHDLVDDQLGTILNNLTYNLVPGASAFITQSVTVNGTVSGNATWTGSTADGAAASESDSTLVTVSGASGFRVRLPQIMKSP